MATTKIKRLSRKALVTREQWLEAGVSRLGQIFEAAGHPLPPVKVSCSWPGGGDARSRIGECWARRMSRANINEIFISPRIANPVVALDVLAHELCHAVDDCVNGHRKPFVKIARAIGLEGKPTSTHAGKLLEAKLVAMVAKMPVYQHRTIDLSSRKKQTTRMLKHTCNECEALWRMTSKYMPSYCPVCRSEDINVGAEAE